MPQSSHQKENFSRNNQKNLVLVEFLDSLSSEGDGEECRRYRISVGEKLFVLYFRSTSSLQGAGMEAVVPLALLPAMRMGWPIHVSGSLSTSFIEGARRVIDFYSEHFPEFHTVELTSDSEFSAKASPSIRTASFFSGGVDSFFTLLKGQGEISDIITLRGFDMSLSDDTRWEQTRDASQKVASALGFGFHELESNFGSVLKEFGQWVEHGHGLALAAAARALSSNFREVRIPGTFSLEGQIPWGSSPFTDPEFSDEALKVTHDSCNATRADKIVFLSKNDLALKYLRVCPGVKNDGQFNCCRCEKCLRTMTALYACDALDRASAFPKDISPKLVAGALMINPHAGFFADENIELMQRLRPSDYTMLRALKKHRNRPVWQAKLITKLQRKYRHFIRNMSKIYSRLSRRSRV